MSIFKRTYQQALWRTRRQTVGAFLAALVGISMVAALYLSVTSRTTLAGREIQSLEAKTSINKQTNADLKTQLASLLSYRDTEQRSDNLGFRAATPEETHYIVVPGYSEQGPIDLAAKPDLNANASTIPAEYTQSLIEWFSQRMRRGRSR